MKNHLFCLPDESGDKSKISIKFPWRLDFNKGNHQGGAFAPDGSVIATGSGKYLLLFESSNGNQLATYSGHKDNITHVVYSDDGKYICTASTDKTMRVWTAPTRSTEPPKGKAKPILEETKVNVNLAPQLASPDGVKADSQDKSESTTLATQQDSTSSSDSMKSSLASLFGRKKSRLSGFLSSVQEHNSESTDKSEDKSELKEVMQVRT